MEVIKFKAISKQTGIWVYGDLIHKNEKVYIYTNGKEIEVTEETVCQFTGVYDKTGKEIYDNDVIHYYGFRTYCVNPDCEPYNFIYDDYLLKMEDVVEFIDSGFMVDGTPLAYIGFESVADIKSSIRYTEEDGKFYDSDGNEITENMCGVVVVSNKFDEVP